MEKSNANNIVAMVANDTLLGDWSNNNSLYTTPYTPITERIAVERPALVEGLDKLRQILGEKQFDKLISPIANITKQGDTLMIIAKNHMQRSLLERECVEHIKQAFAVSKLRIVV